MIKSHSKSMAVASAALALCMAAAGAFAQDRRDDRGPNGFQPQEQQQRQYEHDRNHDGRFNRADRQNYRGDHQDFSEGREADRRGFDGSHAEWRRGDRLPNDYRGRNYVIDDYRMHHLNAPPRGYQWVGVGGDFVLAAVATGVIAQIITGQ
jgi:Ni/Co efflux regulator RcnB